MYLVTTTTMLLTMSTPVILDTDLVGTKLRMMMIRSNMRWWMSTSRRGLSFRSRVIEVGSRRIKGMDDDLRRRRVSMVAVINMVLTMMVTKRMRRRNTIAAHTMMIKEALF